ncbi:MAG TPA: hypothetical protein PLJ47_03320 [Candidatus Hydrogenedentes bacterium]|nr:hypothetical protein [Candidatus Hydrogenedentota bacterium]
MKIPWHSLNESDRATVDAATAFLRGRLERRATIDWALKLSSNDVISRNAVLHAIDSHGGKTISEPFQTAWRLIEESWANDFARNSWPEFYDVERSLRDGELSGTLVRNICQLVYPRLHVEQSTSYFAPPKKRPKKVEDLLSADLRSGETIEIKSLHFEQILDLTFLEALALSLENAVLSGLEIARRLGWDVDRNLWRLGFLYRVYYVQPSEMPIGDHDPDKFHTGIAPATKLLHATVSRIAEIDISRARAYVKRWKAVDSPIHIRLWAAMSRDEHLTEPHEIAELLLSMSDQQFWNLHDYPEIAEVRARRFNDLSFEMQLAVTSRILKFPPINFWRRPRNPKERAEARRFWAARELRRIEIAGAALPKNTSAWMQAGLKSIPELSTMSRIDEGFLTPPIAEFVPANPDPFFNSIHGRERLDALEAALLSPRESWINDASKGASDWFRKNSNASMVLSDFETLVDGGSDYPTCWDRFGWSHEPKKQTNKVWMSQSSIDECERVLKLLSNLPNETVRTAIDGLSHWFSTWKEFILKQPAGISVWLKLWPIAMEFTNSRQPEPGEELLNVVAEGSDEYEPMDLDTLNTPTGRLVDVFFAKCPPRVKHGDSPFEKDDSFRLMRDTLDQSFGLTRLIVKCRLMEFIEYFLKADRSWALRELVPLLLEDNRESPPLWRAFARGARYAETVRIIGETMAERAVDSTLHRESRQRLVFILIVECLHAIREKRDPAVAFDRISQMIRSLDDEVRASAAQVLEQFISEMSRSGSSGKNKSSAEELFRTTAQPFLACVWPQERSLVTPGVSKALADLPATSKGAFSEAVDAIERFLVPFDCWSIMDFGLRGDENGEPLLNLIDNSEKAEAFLRLLDLTIGTSESSVIPYELSSALDHIRNLVPDLMKDHRFRRLATATRRV